MDLEDVALFVAVVRAGSISDAARQLMLTQPTASRRIRRLELDLGRELLSRSGRSVTPTRAGLSLLQFAETALAGEESLREDLRDPDALHGTLQIAASTAPGESFVPALVASFSRRHPDLSAHLHVMDSQAVEACIEEGTCDVGFLGHRPSPGLLHAQVIGHDELVLAVPKGHAAFGKEEILSQYLMRETFVEREPGSGSRRTVEQRLAAAGIPYARRRIALTVSSAQALLAAIRSGIGVGFVSQLALDGGHEDLHGVRVAGIRIDRPLFILWHPRRPKAAEAFVAFACRERSEAREDHAT